MTETIVRPVDTEPVDDEPVRARVVSDTWLSTGDHKRLGLLFIYGGLVALVASQAAALIFFLMSDRATPWTQPSARLALANTLAALVIGVPALWVGIATYVVPLQLGATRITLPRLHNLALWTWFTGGVLLTIAFIADRPRLNSFASSAPSVAVGGRSSEPMTELVIVGTFVVVLALFLAAVSLVTTILNGRADGLRLANAPVFSWSVLATGTVVVVSAPVFLSGLALLFYDHHYGGTVFASGLGGLRVWQHEIWLLGQPSALLFAATAVGIFGEVVASTARRPLIGFQVARAAAIAAPLSTLLLWVGATSTLRSPFAPVATLPAILVGVSLAVALLGWLRTLKASTPRLHAGLLFAASFLIVIALATALSLAAVAVGVSGDDVEAFRNGQITLLMLTAPLLALGGAAVHWSPKLWGKPVPAGAAALQCILILVGGVLFAVPGYLVGFDAVDGDALQPLGAAGAAATIAALLMFVPNVVGRLSTPGSAPPDDGSLDGLTLEWAAPSPPPPHNFETLPEVRSPYPLFDDEGSI